MFTGIIETVGTVKSIRRTQRAIELEIHAPLVCEDLKLGDSVSVNGVCLTATSKKEDIFKVDVIHETLLHSSLSKLRVHSKVNLERAMQMNGRFGGHLVSGHVDGLGILKKIQKDGNSIRYTLAAEPNIMQYIVPKGSVALDGISLTVATHDTHHFTVAVIPFTANETTLRDRVVGDVINLESDVIGKYVKKMMGDS